ncbi:hypothetical protein HK407_12g17320 [Ordospora pajunii]|uniref:uncharacterized protein n=1 Tax=Ordospora pajunii TaxID=3039483 RepID=UPI0029528ADE|nr:uncharacterized protein HK407_12g17320 [Ordospora pajunii]KAH9410601.1 hypothetical protein HK407_12g17320 [Ordospora pajunii]
MDIELISAVVVSYSKILHEMQEMKADIRAIAMSMKKEVSAVHSAMESSQEPCIHIESQSDSIDAHNIASSNGISSNVAANGTAENGINANSKDASNAIDALAENPSSPYAWFFSEIENEI